MAIRGRPTEPRSKAGYCCVDDVVSSGITVRGSVDLIRSLGATPVGLLIRWIAANADKANSLRYRNLKSIAGFRSSRCVRQRFPSDPERRPQYRQYQEQIEDYLREYGA